MSLEEKESAVEDSRPAWIEPEVRELHVRETTMNCGMGGDYYQQFGGIDCSKS